MILNLVQKLNKSIQSNIDNLIGENLYAVNALQNNSLTKLTEIIGSKLSLIDHFKLRVLSSIADKKDIQSKIKQDNLEIIREISKLSPHIADQALEKYFNVNKNVERKGLDLNTANKVVSLSRHTINLKESDFDTKVWNPFTGALLEASFKSYYNKEKTDSNVEVNREIYNNRNSDETHKMVVSLNETYQNRNAFEKIRNMESSDVSFSYILYHEMAHASFQQLTETDQTIKEKNSDISAVIKMAKVFDLSQNEVQTLCDSIIKFRTKDVDFVDYYGKFSGTRSHYTTDALIAFKVVLESELDNIKNIEDKEIPRYASIVIDQHLKNPSIIFGKDDYKKYIDENLLNEMIDDYKNHMKETSQDSELNKYIQEHSISTFREVINEDRIIYEDIIVQKKLNENVNEGIKELYATYKKENQHIGNIVRNNYQLYQDNKKTESLNLLSQFDKKMLLEQSTKYKINNI